MTPTIDLDTSRADLARDLIAWMAEGIPADPSGEARFSAMALRVFAYQYAANAAYRRYCDRRGATPATVGDWRAIPAVATDAFKETPLACFPPEEAAAVFVTSGTTRQVQRGRHYLRTLDLYQAALLPMFVAYVLPDGARLTPVVLGFSPEAMPESSLSHMFGVVVERLCAPVPAAPSGPRGDGAVYFVGPEGVDLDGAIGRLAALAGAGEPVLLMGTAFAFVHLLDALTTAGRRLLLPSGSRIMDTGGYKGRSRDVPKGELYGLYSDVLGVPASHIINEYGMTEMSSQFYDTALRDAALGLPARPRRKAAPPWVRTLVVDPDTLAPLPAGQTGVLRHLDLANLDSVAALQTADLGFADEHGFEIVGRALGAEARGCSLAVEELLRAQPA